MEVSWSSSHRPKPRARQGNESRAPCPGMRQHSREEMRMPISRHCAYPQGHWSKLSLQSSSGALEQAQPAELLRGTGASSAYPQRHWSKLSLQSS